MMVRDRGRCARQLSLESPVGGLLRRQVSEDLRPGPLKIAWAIDPTPTLSEPSNGVEVVAKKYGQPKPPVTKPPRSPFLPDQTAVLFSRQQLTERLRASWKKKNGRHNLNIFLNQSFEGETETDSSSEIRQKTPETSSGEVSEAEEHTLESVQSSPQSTPQPTPEPSSESTLQREKKLCASDRRMNFRNAGRQKVIESPCPTPDLRKPPLQRMMSAPVRAPIKKMVRAPSVDNQRIKSAPPKRKLKPPTRRKTKCESSEEEKSGKKGMRRGVERGEIVTMVSLVSPAESDCEEPPPIQFPPTPDPTPPPPSPKEEPKPPPPPPVICLRKPPKAVSFRPVSILQPNGTQFQTNYTLKRTPVSHQNSSTSSQQIGNNPANQIRSTLQRQNTVQSKIPQTTPPPQQTFPQPIAQHFPRDVKQTLQSQPSSISKPPSTSVTPLPQPLPSQPSSQTQIQSRIAHPPLEHQNTVIKRKPVGVALPIQPIVKVEPKTEIRAEELKTAVAPAEKPADGTEEPEEQKPTVPQFKNQKEKECWVLFKKMSDRGVSVSFETVLRGLLTPTEYRMRRAALLSVC